MRGSKKSFCPSSAAAGESRYLFVVSIGRAGRGESALMIAHSSGEKSALSGLDLPACSWMAAPAAKYPCKDTNTIAPARVRPRNDRRTIHPFLTACSIISRWEVPKHWDVRDHDTRSH